MDIAVYTWHHVSNGHLLSLHQEEGVTWSVNEIYKRMTDKTVKDAVL